MRRFFRKFRAIGPNLLVAWYAWRHPATPVMYKVLLGLAALYIVSPLDLVPDALPVLGWLDDAAILTFTLPALLRLLPVSVLNQARQQATQLRSRYRLRRP